MSDDPPSDSAGRPLAAASIFEREEDGDGGGERFHPTALATGPWYAGTQHGSPMLGLLARAVERHGSDRPRQVVRLTVDLMRAAPLAPVRCVVHTQRPGKSVEIVEASLRSGEGGGDVEYARARAMRFRTGAIDVGGGDAVAVEAPPERPAAASLRRWFGEGEDRTVLRPDAFHHALEMRPVAAFETPTVWFRLKVPLVAGEEVTPLERVAVVSDFTYSVPFMRQIASNPRQLRDRGFVAINPDTSLNLHRPAEGEWVCLDARTSYGDLGAGTAHARLYDDRGPFGHSSQSILVRGTESRPEWSRSQES
ncbi:MAG: thioesterase family protein [Myxococcota bacterium]